MTQRPKGPTDGTKGEPPGHPANVQAASPVGLWEDWITIWQSEFAAMATDREAQAVFHRLLGLWADGARAAGAWLPDGTGGRAAAASPPGPAAAAAAFDARDLALESLARRVEELERRLAGLDGSKPEP
jgi:hypothetical protein